jgi:hypothetical protein
MKLNSLLPKLLPTLLPILLALPLTGCGEAGEKTSRVVEAASRKALEAGQLLAEKTAELAEMAPEEAKRRFQEVVDLVSSELEDVRDSETAHLVAEQALIALAKLVELKNMLAARLDLAGLRTTVEEMAERFKNDPRVREVLESVREKLDTLAR